VSVKRAVLVLSLLALVGTACGKKAATTTTTTTTTKAPAATASPSGSASPSASASPSPTINPNPGALKRIQDRGKIVVGTKFDQPTFGLINPATNKPEGFDVEIAKLLAKAILGDESKVEFTESVSKNREPFLSDGKVDIVVATYTINDARKKIIDFSRPYYVAGQDIMVKKDDSSITGIDSLNGKKVCSAKGSTSEKNIREKAPQAELILFDTYSECADALSDGRVSAVSTDNVILVGLISKNPDFKLVAKPFTTEPYGIGIAKGNDDLVKMINDALTKSFDDGTWKAAYAKTVGKVSGDAPEPPKSLS
jgi:glutamate transport system substrate-binding protein